VYGPDPVPSLRTRIMDAISKFFEGTFNSQNTSSRDSFVLPFGAGTLFNFSGSVPVGTSLTTELEAEDLDIPEPDIILHSGMKTWRDRDVPKLISVGIFVDEKCKRCQECLKAFKLVGIKTQQFSVGQNDRAWMDALAATSQGKQSLVKFPVVIFGPAVWWNISSFKHATALARALGRMEGCDTDSRNNQDGLFILT
jgi:hypothetical protein